MAHTNNFIALSFLGLFCFSFSYGSQSEKTYTEEEVVNFLSKATKKTESIDGFVDAFTKGAYNATFSLVSSLIKEGTIVIAKGTLEKFSRIKTSLEKDSPLSCSELAVINNDIYDSLLPYFSLSPADASKDKRAAALKDELTSSSLIETERSSLDGDSWLNKRYTAEVLIMTYLNVIKEAKETFNHKIEAQKKLSTISIIFYSATDSSKIKQNPFNVITVFELLEYNLIQLLNFVKNSHSEKELVAHRENIKLHFTAISKLLENHVKLAGGSEGLDELKKRNLKFSRPGDSASQSNDILAALGQQSQ